MNHFTLEPHESGLVVRLTDTVDPLNFNMSLRHLEAILHQRSEKSVLLDMRNVDYLQSSNFGQLVSLNNSLSQRGVRLGICYLSEMLSQILVRARLDETLLTFPDEKSGFNCLQQGNTLCANHVSNTNKDDSPSHRQTHDSENGTTNHTLRQQELERRQPANQVRFVRAEEEDWEPTDWGQIKYLGPTKSTACWGSGQDAVQESQKQPVDLRAEQPMGRLHRIYGGQCENFHIHPGQTEEFLFVLSGAVQQWIDHTPKTLSFGDVAYIPPETPHATFNDSEQSATVLVVHSPGYGGFDIEAIHELEPWKSLWKSRGYRGIELERNHGLVIVRLLDSQILDPRGIVQFRQTLANLIAHETSPSEAVILLDFSEVQHLTSAALGVLAAAAGDLRQREGHLAICSLADEVVEVFHLSKMERLISLFSDRQTAISYFLQRQPESTY